MHLFVAHIHIYLDKYAFFILVNIFLKNLTVDNPKSTCILKQFSIQSQSCQQWLVQVSIYFYTCQDTTMIRGFHNISLFEH